MRTGGRAGSGAPGKPVGLIASMFRPSDDATILPFLVPSNFMAVSAMNKAAEILRHCAQKADGAKADTLRSRARQCSDLAAEVKAALQTYAVYDHPKYGKIYAYEVDGFGNQLLMDDANVPSLLGMGYMGDVDPDDPIYQNTRRFVWSADTPNRERVCKLIQHGNAPLLNSLREEPAPGCAARPESRTRPWVCGPP